VKYRNAVVALSLVAFCIVLFAFAASAQEAGRPAGVGAGAGLMGIGAGLAIGLGAVGTGIAQSRIGGAAAGVVAERPEMFGIMLVLLVIPETLVIFGFVIAFFLYGKI
jgi:V/A-type H+/Na+-transporting ATPase subunit K